MKSCAIKPLEELTSNVPNHKILSALSRKITSCEISLKQNESARFVRLKPKVKTKLKSPQIHPGETTIMEGLRRVSPQLILDWANAFPSTYIVDGVDSGASFCMCMFNYSSTYFGTSRTRCRVHSDKSPFFNPVTNSLNSCLCR